MQEVSDSAFRFTISALRLCGFGWLVVVGSGALLLAAAPPGAKPGTGKIAVATQPAGAGIYLDGHAYGKAPAAIEGLGPGRYFVRAELDGYRPAEVVVEISSSQNSQSIALELTSNSAPRPVEPAPPRAAVAKPATPLPATPVPATPAPIRVATPVPVAVAPPRATPAPATPAPAPPGDGDAVIFDHVAAHLKSISTGDIDAYLRLCAAKVDLYDEGMQSQDSIRKSRQKLKERWPVYEITNVRDLTVRPADKPEVKRAAVTYDWNVSNPKTGKKASGTASDILDFKQVGGEWVIVRARQNVERKKSSSQ